MPKISIVGGPEYDCASDDTVLRAALRSGFGFPYECNVGSCGTCKFELIEGAVTHLRTDPPGLTDRDKQRHRFLGCQARPDGPCRIKVGLRDHYKSLHPPKRTSGRLFAIEDHTHDIREFRFRLAQPNVFRPGQYALLYVPGVNGARAYSMCNVTSTGEEWHFQIKRTPEGAATTKLFTDTQLGDAIGLDGPFGMAYLRPEAPRDVLCLAGGSGLSPMISIARAFAQAPSLRDRKLHFVYGGRAARDITGEPMLRDLPGFGSRIFYYPAISTPDPEGAWTGRTGFVADVAKAIFGDEIKAMEIYFAGPPAMADSVLRLIAELKAPPAQAHFDQFY